MPEHLLRRVAVDGVSLSVSMWRDGTDLLMGIGDATGLRGTLAIPRWLVGPLGDALSAIAPELEPYAPFDFVENNGRHRIRVSGMRRPGHVRQCTVHCQSCNEVLLEATNPSLAVVLTALENHG